MSGGGDGIVLPPLPPPERTPEGEDSGEATGESLRLVRRPARLWVEDEDPAYVGAPPSLATGQPPRAPGELPPPSHTWDDVPDASSVESDPFAEAPPSPERATHVRARWIAGGVVVVMLVVLALAVRQRRTGGPGADEVAPAVAWRLPASDTEPVRVDGAEGAPAPSATPPPVAGTRSGGTDDPVASVVAPPEAVPVAMSGAAAPRAEDAAPSGSAAPARASTETASPAGPVTDLTAAPAPALAERRRLAGVPRTAPTFSAGDGLLVVTANQHGNVWIDGVDAGPLAGFVPVELPAGHYPVVVRTAQAERRLDVRVDAGALRRVQVDFAQVPGVAPAPATPPAKVRHRRTSRRRRLPAPR